MKKFFKNIEGAVIAEFMVILPVLMFWFMGMIVFYDAFHKWMKFTAATYTVSDLLSRQTIIEDSFIESLDGLFDSVSDAKSKSDTWIRVSSLRKSAGALEILWAVDTSDILQPTITNADIESYVPNRAIDEHLILIETFSVYNPVFDWVGLNLTNLNEAVASSPRFSSKLVNLDHLNYGTPSDDGVDNPLD
jgi:hypothetical protein